MEKFKRIIPVIFIGVLVAFTFTGCFNIFSIFNKNKISEEDAKAMKGTWQLVAAELEGTKISGKELGTDMSFTFNESDKAKYALDGKTEEYKWEKDGDLITIFVPDDSNVTKGHTATLSDDYFTLYWNYNGKPMKMIFARKGTAAEDPSRYVGNSTTSNSSTGNNAVQQQTQQSTTQQQTASKEPVLLLGDWHLVAKINGTTRKPVEAIDTQNVYYTFYESGEYEYKDYNAKELGMYRRDGNALTVTNEVTGASLVGSLDGDEFTVYNPTNNTNYVYKKYY